MLVWVHGVVKATSGIERGASFEAATKEREPRMDTDEHGWGEEEIDE